jgi:hypothetical protein
MARSHAIYLIRKGDIVLSAHTVKYEAHLWLAKTCWTPEDCTLYRMLDGHTVDGVNCKQINSIPWDMKLYDGYVEKLNRPVKLHGSQMYSGLVSDELAE